MKWLGLVVTLLLWAATWPQILPKEADLPPCHMMVLIGATGLWTIHLFRRDRIDNRKTKSEVTAYEQTERKVGESVPQRLTGIPLAHLIPETQKWNGGKGISPLDWLCHVGSIEHAIAYGELFWPEFVEFDGGVFLAHFKEKSYISFMKQTGGDRERVEAVMNHRHISDIFSAPAAEPTREQLVYLGRLLRELWAAKLRQDYPERRFVVSFPEPDNACSQDYEVSFYEERA